MLKIIQHLDEGSMTIGVCFLLCPLSKAIQHELERTHVSTANGAPCLTFWVISDNQEAVPANHLPSGGINKYQGRNVGDSVLVPQLQLEKRSGGERRR